MSIISEPSMSEDCPCGDGEKKCKRCGLCFPETTEHFMRHKRGKNGLHPWCRTCYAAYQRAHYADNQEARVQQKRQYNEDHREQRLIYSRKYTEEHHEEVLARKERYRFENKDKLAAKSREYYREHPEEMRIHSRLRRSRKKGAGGKFKKRDVANLYEMQKGCCCWCGKEMVNRLLYKKVPPELHSKIFTIDHITAVRRGGSNWAWNLVLACKDCNSSRKHKYVFSEWQPPAMLEHMQGYIVRSVILEVLWKLWR
mgnify:CR=1 FL=1